MIILVGQPVLEHAMWAAGFCALVAGIIKIRAEGLTAVERKGSIRKRGVKVVRDTRICHRCGAAMTDQPGSVTEVTAGDLVNRISETLDLCPGRPDRLSDWR